MDKDERRRKIMEQKCRKCGYSYITGLTVQCDYLAIMGHSRGCSIEDCRLHKDHPREWGDTKARAYNMRPHKTNKGGQKKKDDPAVQALTDAIMGKGHE